MDAAERDRICQHLVTQRMRLGLPLEDVRRIDHHLTADWGITLPKSPAQWKRRLQQLGGKDLAAEYWWFHDALASQYQVGNAAPEALETRFYDTLADPRICGHVHSQKRTEILDAACLLVYLAHALKVRGPILDVGCHTGHHTHLLALETGCPVIGIDLSSKAVETARSKTAGIANLTFSDVSLSDPSFIGAFEMLYAVRSIDLNVATVGPIAAALQPGGVAVILPSGAPDESTESRAAILQAGLGFGLSDVVGGWVGEERDYEAGPVLVLIKGGTRLIPDDFLSQAASMWSPHFEDYANNSDTPWPEKTQAYCRGHWIKSNPA